MNCLGTYQSPGKDLTDKFGFNIKIGWRDYKPEKFFYLGTEFENDLEFYWDYCEYNAESDDYMCWLSDWELDDSGQTFSQCEVYST